MEALLLVVVALGALGVMDLLAWLKGADSTDAFESSEWQKRHDWSD